MTRGASWLAILYVALLPVGRSGLPLNAQWADLLFPLVAIAVIRSESTEKWWRKGDWFLAAYIAVTFGMALVSADPWAGLGQVAKQVYAAAIFFVFRQMALDLPLTARVPKAFVLSMTAIILGSISVVFLRIPERLSLSTLGESHALPFFGVVRRLRGALEAPEFLGNALLVAFVLALALRLVGSSRAWWTAIATILAAGEFLTYSHSVAGFCVAAVFFWARRLSSRAVRALAWTGALAVVVIVNAASLVGPRSPQHGTHYEVGSVSFDFLGKKVEGQLMSYAALKQLAWSAFLDHPLKGIGPGRFQVETEAAFEAGRLPRRYRQVAPHCDLAGRLAETGVLGGLSLLSLWATWLRGIRWLSATAPPLQSAAAAAVLGLLVNSLNADIMNFRFLWIVLAWMAWPVHPTPARLGSSPPP